MRKGANNMNTNQTNNTKAKGELWRVREGERE